MIGLARLCMYPIIKAIAQCGPPIYLVIIYFPKCMLCSLSYVYAYFQITHGCSICDTFSSKYVFLTPLHLISHSYFLLTYTYQHCKYDDV